MSTSNSNILDHFCRLFWPKEMRELVEKYEAQGVLNKDVQKNISKEFSLILLLLVIIFLIGSMMFWAILISVTLLWYCYEMHKQYVRVYQPYIDGEKIPVIIKRVEHNGWRLESLTIECSSLNSKASYFIGKLYGRGFSKLDLPKKGDQINIWVNKSSARQYAMPDTPSFRERFSLLKTIL